MVLFTIFFDQAVIVRRNTIYQVPVSEKVVALTFDDGPSPKWTPEILDALKAAQVKATFFMLGKTMRNSIRMWPGGLPPKCSGRLNVRY